MTKSKSFDLSGFLGPGTEFEGVLRFDDTLRIEGTFRGRIESPEANLVVAEGGKVCADIDVGQLFVAGAIEGTVQARRRLEISRKGEICGDVYAPNLIIREGAVFDGVCHMEGSPPPKQEKAESASESVASDEPGKVADGEEPAREPEPAGVAAAETKTADKSESEPAPPRESRKDRRRRRRKKRSEGEDSPGEQPAAAEAREPEQGAPVWRRPTWETPAEEPTQQSAKGRTSTT